MSGPARLPLPLPFAYSAPEATVRADLAKRFPGADHRETMYSYRGVGK